MEKKWTLRPSPDKKKVKILAEELSVSFENAYLLFQRNITTFEAARNYFRPKLEDLHNPFLMKDMDLAVERLHQSILKGERILIYGDYDVDGTTSVSLVYGFLRNLYPLLDYYVPDRYKEGYGVSRQGIDFAIEKGCKLIITLDCGVKAVNMISYAKEAGIDVIVCDHHNPEELPPAYAILDPKRKDCNYPYKELSGCGIGFKFMQGYCEKYNIDLKKLYWYLDLVVVSIASDIVPITGENRILSYFGTIMLNKKPRPGLKALIDIAGYKKDLDIGHIVFGIGPRINAAGRIAHAKGAIDLLLCKSSQDAENRAELVNVNNTKRKDLDMVTFQEALEMIETDSFLQKSRSTVLFKNDWHKGVIGIVASRCIEKYYRPTIILTESEGMATGSARSVRGFDLYEAISRCSEYLEQFGGHTHAAGLTLKKENVENFRKKFEEVVCELISEESLIPSIDIDMEITLEKINARYYRIVKQMGPFGPGNMQPVFVTRGLKADGTARLLKEEHLKMKVSQNGSQEFEAIGFGMRDFYEGVVSGKRFDLAYSLSENNFGGINRLQLNIKDIKFIS